jgi:tetratricopeptide (TPR) repeat protein
MLRIVCLGKPGLMSMGAALLVVLGMGCSFAAQPTASSSVVPVRVWQGTVDIPTSEMGLPDPNPPFDYFVQDYRHIYPYTSLSNLTGRSVPRRWRTLNLENEFIRCTVLPDLGGHIDRCTDKRNGAEMFYANPSVKLARIAYRGAWSARGVEFNFPISHNWMTVSPVDFSTSTAPDGSASVWVGNRDRVYGMQWQVQLTLRPGQVVLEEHVTLDNPSNSRHRFYWWTNAGVQSWDDSRLYYPQQYSVFHGFTDLDTWPVNSAGVDLSVVGNHKYGPVSRFSYGSAEPYMAIYHPHTHAGLVHYSSADDLPSKKVFSWGNDADGMNWREALSDNHSAYVELQAGLFRDQETHGFLEPLQSIHFSEYWIPIQDLEEVTRANRNAVLSISRNKAADSSSASLKVSMNVTREFPQATVTVRDGARVLSSERVSLSPKDSWHREYAALPPAAAYTVAVTDREGKVILEHTEGKYDFTPKSEIPARTPPAYVYPAANQRSEDDFVELGADQEKDGKLLEASSTYAEGLKKFHDSVALHRSLGRLEVALMRYAAAARDLRFALDRVSNDHEVAYYLALAQLKLGDSGGARRSLEAAEQYGVYRPAARFELAAMASRQGQLNEAQHALENITSEAPGEYQASALNVSLLRLTNQKSAARKRLAALQHDFPTDSFLRLEAVRLGQPDAALWEHLAADPERIVEIAAQYIHFGLYGEAIDLLAHSYPASEAGTSDPGTPSPAQYPLIAYYRGYCRYAAGQDGSVDFAAAAQMPTDYVFPNRPEQLEIFARAIAVNPTDASAHYFLGSLYMTGGMVEQALAEWELARQIRPGIPTLLRSMGFATLASHGSPQRALELFTEGTRLDPKNASIYLGLEQAMQQAGSPIESRIHALRMFPADQNMPSELVFQLARDLAEAGRFDDAIQQMSSHFVAREEGGVGMRQVYLDIRIQEARALSSHNQCDAARDVIRHLSDAAPTLSLTQEELALELKSESRQKEIASIETVCGK